MKVALAVNLITHDIPANLSAILDRITEAAGQGADLIIFPEAALTGLINDDIPEQDLPLGQEIPGETTRQLAAACQAHPIWLGIGLLERDGDQLYDTALLLAPDGEIKLKYRRISAGWHGRQADPTVYKHGSSLSVVPTPFGSMAFLICGDLFDDQIVEQMHRLQPDWLLFPFARCFSAPEGQKQPIIDQARWEREELPEYIRRIQKVGTPTLLVNTLASVELEEGSFGGAWVIDRDGQIQASLPLGQVGLLISDL